MPNKMQKYYAQSGFFFLFTRAIRYLQMLKTYLQIVIFIYILIQ